MIEDALGESLTSGVSAKDRGETEGLNDGEVSLDVVHGSTGPLGLLEDDTTLGVEGRVDTTKGILGGLDLNEVDGLAETGLGSKLSGIDDTASGGDNLTTTTMDGISVEDNIAELEDNAAEVLLSHGTLLASPLHGSNARILNLIEVLNTLGDINHHVGAIGIGGKAPNLLGNLLVPTVLLRENLGANLGVITRTNLAGLNSLGETILHRTSLNVETVMLVGGLGHDNVVRHGRNSLTERNDGVVDLELSTTHEILLKILQANLKMEFTGTSNNVLTSLLNDTLNHGVRAGKTLKTLNELGKIGGVLGLDGNADDGGHRELHGLQGASILSTLLGNGGGLGNVLVETDKGNSVTARNILNSLLLATHAKDSTLNRLGVEILLLTRNIVGTHDTALLASTNFTGEDTTESEETTLIGSRNHLRNVDHKRAVGIAVADGSGIDVIEGTLVKNIDTVPLSLGGGRKVVDDHLKESLVSGKPALHDTLHEGLAHELLVIGLELAEDIELLEHREKLVLGVLHGKIDDGLDGVINELNETTLATGGVSLASGPLLSGGVEEVVTPKLGDHTSLIGTELGGVHLGEGGEGESPTVETGRERDGGTIGVNLDVTHGIILVGGHDNVGVLNDTEVSSVGLLTIKHQLKEAAIHLVDSKNGPDTLGKSLTKDSLSLDADTLNAINDDESTIGNTESSGNLRGEINVTGRVDKVDKVIIAIPLALEALEVLLSHLVVKRDTSGLDGNTTLLLISTGIGQTGITSLLNGHNTSGGDERVGKGRLTVIDVGNNGHVTDVVLLVHDSTDLLNRKLHHFY
mmetsp:Transcript_14922/g.26360  ORF Transcript_14922/g.26360 Transcript_14922/m.26360 type:complete len:806 (-) Transcript_14922:95-2512(-)